ncbi:MAG: PaaI family thioesterase [Rubrobacteraceae bacterium]
MSENTGYSSGAPCVPAVAERVRASFSRQGLMKTLGAELVDLGQGLCVVEVPFSEKITQQDRYFHGAVIGAIADTASGYAAMTLASPDREVLTVEYKVNFLTPAQGAKLVARGEVVTAGRRLFVCRADVSAVGDDVEEVCATTLQTVSLAPVRTEEGSRTLPGFAGGGDPGGSRDARRPAAPGTTGA